MTTKLSVIVATYNSEKTLNETLESLLAQTYRTFEVIVIDGLSKDGTVFIIKKYEPLFLDKNIKFYWVSESDSGIYDAWNKGLKKTNSDWIGFLGSDDMYHPSALENYATEMDKQPNINYICSKVEIINESGAIVKIMKSPYEYKQVIRYMDFAHVGSFHHRELFERYGNFDITYKIAGDYDFFLRCGNNIRSGYLNKITARMLNSGVSNVNFLNPLKEGLKAQLKHKRTSFFQIYFEYYFAIFRVSVNRLKHILAQKLGRL